MNKILAQMEQDIKELEKSRYEFVMCSYLKVSLPDDPLTHYALQQIEKKVGNDESN